MKILEAKGELVEQKSCPGLFECKMTHKIKETSATFHYLGPKFTEQMWDEVLAFFKWTYAKTRGESQVRLFVHPQQGWRAWAFPQEASTGLATKELPDNPETKAQNAAIQPNDDWIPYGTIHHHCSASAFQSGTDEHNERGAVSNPGKGDGCPQEGIHITVGNIDKEVHSLHFRFYYRGCKFQPDLTEFWDVGDGVRAKAREFLEMFGGVVDLNKQAEAQMALTCPADTAFPEQWMANLIERKLEIYKPWTERETEYWNGCQDYNMDQGYQGYPSRVIKALRKHFRKLYKEEIKANGRKLTPEIVDLINTEVADLIKHVATDIDLQLLIKLLLEHNTKVIDLEKRFDEMQLLEKTTPADIEPEEPEEVAEEGKLKTVHSMTDAEFADYMQGGGRLPGQI